MSKPTYEELLDCVHNFVGIFDTPQARIHINSSMAEEARQIGRDILERSGRDTWVRKE
jgi:hypothetical protein